MRRAVDRGDLTPDGFCVAEGVHLLEEAVSSRCEIAAILQSESARVSLPPVDARVYVLAQGVFDELSTTTTSQGVIALVRPPAWTMEQTLQRGRIAVVLDGIQDPGNAGAIVRTAEAFGASGILFLKGTVSPFNTKCLRASAGSLFRFPFLHAVSDEAMLAVLRENNLPLFCTMPDATMPLGRADLRQGGAIVIGSEGRGVRPELLSGATGLRIPTRGVESLNAAVAAGVVLYEAQRQRPDR